MGAVISVLSNIFIKPFQSNGATAPTTQGAGITKAVTKELALTAMKLSQGLLQLDGNFMKNVADISLPIIAGCMGQYATKKFECGTIRRTFDLIVTFTVGEWSSRNLATFSTYFDPKSPWFNGYYGSYSIRSWKWNGLAHGFDDENGTKPNINEMMDVFFLDYNFLTGMELGCPPDRLCFHTEKQSITALSSDGWFQLEWNGFIPSCLYNPKDFDNTKNVNASYLACFGVPQEYLLTENKMQPYQPTKVRAVAYFKQMPTAKGKPKVTLLCGSIFYDNPESQEVLERANAALRIKYAIPSK